MRSHSTGRTGGTAWFLDSASEQRKSKANRRTAHRPRQPELAVIQAAGDDDIDDLHYNRHDVNEVGTLGAQSLLVNDAVHLVYGLGGIAEQGAGPDARPSWAGSGPRVGGCPPICSPSYSSIG